MCWAWKIVAGVWKSRTIVELLTKVRRKNNFLKNKEKKGEGKGLRAAAGGLRKRQSSPAARPCRPAQGA